MIIRTIKRNSVHVFSLFIILISSNIFAEGQTQDKFWLSPQKVPTKIAVGKVTRGVGISSINLNKRKARMVEGLTKGSSYKQGELLVKFKSGVSDTDKESVALKYGAYSAKSVMRGISYLRGGQGNGASPTAKRFAQLKTLERWSTIKLPAGASMQFVMESLADDPNVEWVEPNYLFTIHQTPTDPRYNELWGLHNTGQTYNTSLSGLVDVDIDAPEAWDITTGSNAVIVAVIDSGVDYNHEDLAANMWTNTNEIANNGLDDDGNGYIDDYYGVNTIINSGDPMDDQGHGTHVSGTIAAVANNGIGVVGVSWQSKIMAIKFLNAAGTGSTGDAIKGINYAIAHGASIINASWGGYSTISQLLRETLLAANDAGILFVAAAGNETTDTDLNVHSPSSAETPNMLAVAALDSSDVKPSWSNYGLKSVDLGGPGVEVLSSVPTGSCGSCLPGGYDYFSGTSMATPHVAGAAALLYAQFPGLKPEEYKQILMTSVDPVASLEGKTVTGGRVNAHRALTEVSATFNLDVNSYTIPTGVNQRSFIITARWLNGNTTPLSFSVNTNRPDISSVLTSSNLTPDANGFATSTLTLDTTSTVPAGVYPVDISATDGTHTLLSEAILIVTDADLEFLSINAPPNAVLLGDPMTVVATIRNNSAAALGPVYFTYHFSEDQVIDITDRLLLEVDRTWRRESFTGGETKVITYTDVRIPKMDYSGVVPEGPTYFGGFIDSVNDVLELNESNNGSPAVLMTLNVGTDLTINAAAAPSSAVCGVDELMISVTGQNIGTGDTRFDAPVSVYLSANTTIDPSQDIELTPIGANAFSSISVTRGAPATTMQFSTKAFTCAEVPPGDYMLGLVIDPQDRESESNETNNQYSLGTFSVSRGTPDMIISAASGPPEANQGTYITVSFTERNIGAGTISSHDTVVYLSGDDAIIEPSDTPICTAVVTDMQPGFRAGEEQLRNYSCSGSIPSNLASKVYYLGVIADPSNQVAELNETNNTKVAHAIGIGVPGTVVRPQGVDYTLSELEPNVSQLGVGEEIKITFTLQNLGSTATIGSTQTQIFLSTDNIVTTADIAIGAVTTNWIASGASTTITLTLPYLNKTITPGIYYVGAITDVSGLTAEADESNNSRLGPTVELVRDTDLIMTQVDTRDVGLTGSEIEISNTIKNVGSTGADADVIIVRFLLSQDSDYTTTADNVSLGQRSVLRYGAPFASQEIDSSLDTVKLPPTMSPGIYNLIAVADYSNSVTESDETNNAVVMSRPYEITKEIDFVGTTLNAPASIPYDVSTAINGGVVANKGGSMSDSTTTVDYYLSQDHLLSGDDFKLFSVNIGTVIAYRSVTTLGGNVTLTSSDIAPGNYHILMDIDPADKVLETNEDNNVFFSPTKVSIGLGAPTARAGGPYSGTQGQAIVFDGSQSTDPENDTITYSWDFGDNSAPGSGVSPSHIFSVAGNYTVSLTVSDGTYNSSPSTAVVSVAASGNVDYSLALSTPVASPNDTVAVSWTAQGEVAGATTSSDWVGLYMQGATDTQYLQYQYVRIGQPQLNGGTLNFTLGSNLAPGTYEFRYLQDNGYSSVVASPPLTIQ